MDDIKIDNLVKKLFKEFEDIGKSKTSNGVTRLGYSKEEDEMHEKYIELGRRYGFFVSTDSVGNSILSNVRDGEEYFVIASHLDSVVDGGRYDGVLGVLTGLAILIISKEENLNIPLKVIAFRCEENNTFSIPTVGSKFFSGLLDIEKIGNKKSIFGDTMSEIFEKRGYSPKKYDLTDAKNYIEVHIEQARVLEDMGLSIGIVSGISGILGREVEIIGMSEHAGATPMELRRDAFTGASEIALSIEKIAREYEKFGSRGTVGKVNVSPNAMNVVPGNVKFTIDLRGIDGEKLEEMYGKITNSIEEITKKRNLEYKLTELPGLKPVKLNEDMIFALRKSSENLNIKYLDMPSGAGHDAMNIADILPTAMLFVPCKDGLSHNPNEDINTSDMVDAIKILIDFYKNY